MSKIDLSEVNSWDLIKELESRGYFTDLIFGTQDVDANLVFINDARVDKGEEPIELTKDEKEEIVKSCFNVDWYAEQMNDDIYEQILRYEKTI